MIEHYVRHPNCRCSKCGKLLYRRPVQLKKESNRVFCSKKCFGLACRKESACPVCKKLILAGQNKNTCSRACANSLRLGMKYKLGSARKNKVTSYRQLKIRLLEFQGHFCQRCGYNKHQILQIHHRDRNHSNNDLANLELVCPNCHYEEHYLEKSWFKDLQ